MRNVSEVNLVGVADLSAVEPVLAALFGAGLAASRADGPTSMLFCLAFGLFHFFVVGGMKFQISPGVFLLLVSTSLLWMVLGWALGAAEDLKRHDGT